MKAGRALRRSLVEAWGRIDQSASQAKTRAAAARDNAAAARDNAVEIRNRVRDGVDNLTDDMRMMIGEAIDDIRKAIEEELEDREGFTTVLANGESECDMCRQRLFDFLTDLDTILLEVQAMTLQCTDIQPISLQPLIRLIQDQDRQVPCRILVALCKAFDLSSCLVDTVKDASTALTRVREILGEPDGMEVPPATDVNDPRSFVDAEVEACAPWLANYDELVVRSKSLAKASTAIGQVGGLLSKEPCKSGQAGIHGYAHLQLSVCVAQKFGNALEKISNAAESVIGVVRTNIVRCVQRQTDQLILDKLQVVLCNQQPGLPECSMGWNGQLP